MRAKREEARKNWKRCISFCLRGGQHAEWYLLGQLCESFGSGFATCHSNFLVPLFGSSLLARRGQRKPPVSPADLCGGPCRLGSDFAIAFHYRRIGFVDCDEPFEVLNSEVGKGGRALVVDAVDR